MHEDFQVHVDSDWVGDLLGRKNTTGVVVRKGMTGENKITLDVARQPDLQGSPPNT